LAGWQERSERGDWIQHTEIDGERRRHMAMLAQCPYNRV